MTSRPGRVGSSGRKPSDRVGSRVKNPDPVPSLPREVRNEICCCVTANVLGCRLRVEVMRESTGQWLWAEYDNMTVESEKNNYTLHVTGYHGNAGDAFSDDHHVNWQSNGMPFSTPDVDNDIANAHCASNRGSGWWFKWCSASSLNGGARKTHWYSERRKPIRVSSSRMMIQCSAA